MSDAGLDVRGLQTVLSTGGGPVPVISDISFTLRPGETLCLVGESGSGKSMTALSIVRLLPAAARVNAGEILLGDIDLARLPDSGMRSVRGRRVAMVFQDSMTSLNPLLTIGRQLTEGMELHLGLSPAVARERAVALLAQVGVPAARERVEQYPHQLSGGLRQRAAIAIALSAEPEILIADEPTTALDVTTQAQILELLAREQQRRGMGLLLITHDVGVVARMATTVGVMYAGRIVEKAPSDMLFRDPRHPYTRGLLKSVPRMDTDLTAPLTSIPGTPPAIANLPEGCSFNPRCPSRFDRCLTERPPLIERKAGHPVACHLEDA
ncbi:MAG: ABC transporter ATP-binding protein [Rhizobiales bacterium]|nr:ABC transporter ATP-binding protein [Hyphomicrobiales bacterium]